MKNGMFKRLYEQFLGMSQEMLDQVIPGGRSNPDNSWYYNMLDSLKEVSDVVEKSERTNEEAKAAFDKLAKASSDIIAKGRNGIPQEMQRMYTTVLSIKKPVDFYAEKLNQGESLDDALANPGWIENYFTADERATDRPNYVPGQYTTDGMSIKQMVINYNTDAEMARQSMDKHLKVISGDENAPIDMIRDKIKALHDFVVSYGDDPKNVNFGADMLRGYNTISSLYDRQNISDITDNEHIFAADFFGRIFDNLYDSNIVVKDVKESESLPDQAKNLLASEIKKLKFSADRVGVSKETIERFEKNTMAFQQIGNAIMNLKADCEGERDLSEDSKTAELMPKLDGFLNSVAAYLKGENGIELPTDEELGMIGKEIAGILQNENPIMPDGQLNEFYEDMLTILSSMNEATTTLNGMLQQDLNNARDKLKFEYLNFADSVGPETPKKTIGNVNRTFMNLSYRDLVDRDFRNQAIYMRMARDPEYCKEMTTMASNAIEDFAQNVGTKPAFTDESFFSRFKSPSSKEPFPEEMLYEEAYTMFLIGKQIESERQKMQNLDSKDISNLEKIKNPVNAEFKKIFDAENIGPELFENLKSTVETVKNSEVFKWVKQGGPVAARTTIKNKEKVAFLVNHINSKPDLLQNANDATLEALTQTSGNLGSKNSESYQKISDSIADIYKKNATKQGATHEDYLKLYNNCKSYALDHDSVPTSTNGLMRETAAMKMMNTLGSQLVKDHPELETHMMRDNAVNMARSKAFRDMNVKVATENIKKIINDNKDILMTDFTQLPQSTRDQIASHFKTLSIAKGLDTELQKNFGKQIAGKCETEAAMLKIAEKVNGAFAISDKMMKQLKKDPMSILEQIEPALKTPAPEKQAALKSGTNISK